MTRARNTTRRARQRRAPHEDEGQFITPSEMARLFDRGVYFGPDRDGRVVYFVVTDEHKLLIEPIVGATKRDDRAMVNALFDLLDAMSPKRQAFTLRMPKVFS